MGRYRHFIAMAMTTCAMAADSIAQGYAQFQSRRIPDDISVGVPLDISNPEVRRVFRIGNIEYGRQGVPGVFFSYVPKDKLEIGEGATVSYNAYIENGIVQGTVECISLVSDKSYGEKLRIAANLFELQVSLCRAVYGSLPPVEFLRSDNLLLAEKHLGKNAKEADKVIFALGHVLVTSNAQVVFMDGRQTRFYHFTVSVDPARGKVAVLQSERLLGNP